MHNIVKLVKKKVDKQNILKLFDKNCFFILC